MKALKEQETLQNQALKLLSEVANTFDENGDETPEGKRKLAEAHRLMEESKALDGAVRLEKRQEQIKLWSKVLLAGMGVLGAIYYVFLFKI